MPSAPKVVSLLAALVALSSGCRRAPDPPHMPRYNVNVSVGPDSTMLGATFTQATDLAYSDANCAGVRLRNRRDPPSQPGGRVTVSLASGEVLGQVTRSISGSYLAAVRRTLGHGERIGATIAGGGGVPSHTFRGRAVVPSAVAPTAPASGFRHAPGSPLRLAWSGGDSSHVAVLVTAARGRWDQATDSYQLSCVLPRAPGSFTLPGAALRRELLPQGADTLAVVLVADGRVVEGEYALDVTPIATGGNVLEGSLTR